MKDPKYIDLDASVTQNKKNGQISLSLSSQEKS